MPARADQSTRYVLPAGSPLVENLAALWAADPALARAVEGRGPWSVPSGQLPVASCKEAEGASYAVEASKDGAVTVAVTTGDGRRVHLHSRYRPVEEGRRLAESAEVEGKAILIVHGFGLGYHVERLFEMAGERGLIYVLEPDLRMLRTALEHRDFSAMVRSRRVVFLWRRDKAELFTRLTPHSALLSMGLSFIAHAPSVQLQPDFHRDMGQWIGEFAAYCRTNLNTLVLNGKRTCENIARNIGWYVATPGMARLSRRFGGHPAIVVSAGPSLRKNKHLLKDAAGRAVIIAVQTTLQPLLDMDVEPQFVTSLDYHDICTRFFEKLPRGLRTELVAEPKASSAIFELHPGPLSLCGNELAERLVREMRPGKARLPSGATVAHLAYYLAEHLGCDPIIFVGQDLGFSDGLCYAPGTSYDDVWRPELSRFCTVEMKQWEHIVRERQILRRIPDYQGRPMYTEERLFTYLQQFERDFLTTRTRIIDATEGGALKRGATVMPLSEAMERFCNRSLPRYDGGHTEYRWELVEQAIGCLESRRSEASRIERIAGETMPLLEEIRDHLDDRARVNRAIARVDLLRARMNEHHETYDLVMQMTQRSELQRFQRDHEIAASNVRGVERQRRQVQRDIENVRSVIEASEQFGSLMRQAVEQAAGLAGRHRMEKAA